MSKLRNSPLGWVLIVAMLGLAMAPVFGASKPAEPPADWVFRSAKMETLTPSTSDVLTAPEAVAGKLAVAKTAPVIEFGLLPGQWKDARLWSNWGGSIFASDGNYYCAIGDHQSIHGHSYVYKVNPASKDMQMVVDFTKAANLAAGDYSPGKIHCPLMELDGWLYFIGYPGGSGRDDEHHYKGDPMLRYQLSTGKIEQMPIPAPYCCVPSSVIYAPKKVMYALATAGENSPIKGDMFVAYDLVNNKVLFQGGPPCDVTRSILVTADGVAYYSSGHMNPPKPQVRGRAAATQATQPAQGAVKAKLAKYDPKTNTAVLTNLELPGPDGQLRAASRPNAQGISYGITQDGYIFSFDAKTERITEITRTVAAGPPYTAICKLSPDERYLYYVPSAHGGSIAHGTSVMQLDVKTGERKVIAFLSDYLRNVKNYHCGGTFGIDISADGGTLGICFNGKKLDDQLSQEGARPDFDRCAVVMVHIPESERR